MGWISLEGDDVNVARRHRKMVKHKCSKHGLSKYMMRLLLQWKLHVLSGGRHGVAHCG